WDPEEKVETFTVQPKFEGNAMDFGMVIPTPSRPKLHEMPRDFFKHLAVYSILKKRTFPHSKLISHADPNAGFGGGVRMLANLRARDGDKKSEPSVKVLESGVVGS